MLPNPSPKSIRRASTPRDTPTLATSSPKCTTPSALCSSDTKFTKWRIAHFAQLFWKDTSSWAEWPRNPDGTFNIEALQRAIPRPYSKRDEVYWLELQRLIPIAPTPRPSDSLYDETSYGIIRSASVLYDSFHIFEQLPSSCKEAALRQPFNQLMRYVFGVDGNLYYLPECHIPLPPIPLELRQELNLADGSTARGDAGVLTFATLDLSALDQLDAIALELNSQLYLFSSPTDPQHEDGIRRLAVPEVVIEMKTADLDTVVRHLQLDLVAMLLHRRRIGLDDRPLYGIVMNARQIYYAEASWDGEAPTVTTSPSKKVKKFEDWIELYLFLMKIRLDIEANGVPTIKVYQGTRESSSKRSKEDSQDGEPSPDNGAPPRKRARMDAGRFIIEGGTSSSTHTQVHDADNTPTEAVEAVTPRDPVPFLRSPVPTRPHAFKELLGLGLSGLDGLPLENVHMDGEGREMLSLETLIRE